jgi:hypothetical protein
MQFCLSLDDITRNRSNHWLSVTCQSYALIVEHFIGSRNALKTVLPRHLASPCAVIMAQSFSTVSPTLQIDFDVYSREAHAGLAHYELAVARLASAWAWLGLARAGLTSLAHAGLAHYELAVARLASAWAWLGLARAGLAR